MIRKFFTTVLLAFLMVAANAQLSWPSVSQLNKPWTRWWWEGSAVNKKDLSAVMKLYQEAGLGGLEITPIYGVKGYEDQFIDFLSPKWMDMLQHTLTEGKRLGLGIDLANATGWPFGGPWVSPEDACKNVNMKMYALKEGEQLNELISFTQQPLYRSESHMQVDLKTLSYPIATNKNLQSYAFDQVRFEKKLPLYTLMAYSDKGEVIDLLNKVDVNGKLNWTASQGNWKLVALFIGLHGKMVERAAPGGEGDVIDHFNKNAIQHYLHRFDNAFTGHDISGIRAFFNDSYEVDDARGQSNWTPEFFTEFKQRRGYDLKNYLPYLFAMNNSDSATRILTDYRETISDLLLDNFTKQWHNWAASKNHLVRNQSHGSPANILDLYSVIDIPETEGTEMLRFKFATSAAHVMGKPLVSSESATWLNEHFLSSWADVKQAIDNYFIGGVNHIFYHGVAYSPLSDPWPGWLFYAAVHFQPTNPMWKDFDVLNHYIAHTQSFLQQGKISSDVLVYYPIFDSWNEYGRDLLKHYDAMKPEFTNTAFEANATLLQEKGYAFDYISDKQLLQVQSKNAMLQTGGINYQTIVIPDAQSMPFQTLQQLNKLAESGATVVFYKGLPKDVPGFSGIDKRKTAFADIVNALHFSSTQDPSIRKANIGNGCFLLGTDLNELLRFAKVRRESMADDHIEFVRRKNENGYCYFIVNRSNKNIDGWIPLQIKAIALAMFNPLTLEKGLLKMRVSNNGTEVYLSLKPDQSVIIQSYYSAIKANAYPTWKTNADAKELTGVWTVKFVDGGPTLPKQYQTKELRSWTEQDGDEVKNFSGTAEYSISFTKPNDSSKTFLLDLGKVHETAEVFLNGKLLRKLIGPDYSVIIHAAELKKENSLQVRVSNLMANRIAYMDKNNISWKKFNNTNFPARLAQNRNANGLFTAVKWQPRISGLLGPVNIESIELKK